MILRLLLLIFIIYYGRKLIKSLFEPNQEQSNIKGNSVKKKPLDLSNYDIEDADFEEIDD